MKVLFVSEDLAVSQQLGFRWVLPGLFLGVLGVQALGGFSEALAAPSEKAELAQLQKGQVVVREESAGESKSGQRRLVAKILIDRSLDDVWQVISKQENLFKGDPHMKKVQVVKRPSPVQEWVQYTLSISPFLPTFVYITQVDYQRAADKLQFHRISGSFKEFQGFCTLAPADKGNKTLLTYGLQVDVGFFIPAFIVRQILKNELPSILNRVEQQVYKQFPTSVDP